MANLFPRSFTPKFSLPNQYRVALPYFNLPATKKHWQAITLAFALQKLWAKMQSAYKGNRKWAKSIDKYIQRYFKQFDFYPLTKKMDGVLVVNQPLFKHITYLKNITQPLSKHGFNQFIEQANALITQHFSRSEDVYLSAKQCLTDFIEFHNQNYIIQEYHYAIPAPPVKPISKENPLIIAEDYVAQGKKLVKIVKHAMRIWQTQKRFNGDEIKGWLVFSGIIFGGINFQPLLSAWFETVLKGEFIAFDNQRLLMSVRYPSDKYGNELVGEQLFNTQQITVDTISQCWLYRYRQNNLASDSKHDIEKYLVSVLQPIYDDLGFDKFHINWLLKNASYCWTMLNNNRIDQASVGVMQGKHKTTGLIHNEFMTFLQATHQIDIESKKYDLLELSKLTIVSKQHRPKNAIQDDDTTIDTDNLTDADANPLPHQKSLRAQVRKSSVVERIQAIFATVLDKKYSVPKDPVTDKKLDKDQILEKQITSLSATYSLPSERILAGWIVSLIQAKSANHKSILQYLGSIGYEWIYFTNAQAIQIWDEEDFVELYDEILDYKSQILGNEDIGYTARRLQALHDYALKAGFTPVRVIIKQAKTKRKVRAKLLPPQTYIAMIEQIQSHVNGLDSEMLCLMFMLAYHTGMRKKELLGLTYGDFEALMTDEPSLIIRPNIHRSTKTEGSIRRIPFYSLLTNNECSFATQYVRSQHGGKFSRLVFTFNDSQTALPNHFPLQFLQKVLKDINADENTTFHTLRHCALTNLALVLNADKTLASRLTGYSDDEIEKIRQGILGVETNAQDKWYALAEMMGHLSPERGFEYYNHVAMLMATYAINNADSGKYFKLESFINITGFNKVKLKENGYLVETANFELTQLRPLLLRLMMQKTKPIKISCPIDNTADLRRLNNLKSMSENLIERYSTHQVLDFLGYLDKEVSLDKASIETGISEKDAQIIYQNASFIANLRTQKGKAKFTKEGKLSPLAVQTESEKKLQRLMLTQFKSLLITDREILDWLIKLGLDKLSTEQSALPLSIDELERFIPIAKLLSPEKDENWLIHYDRTNIAINHLLMDTNFSATKKLTKPLAKKSISRQRRRTKACEIGLLYQNPNKNGVRNQFSSVLRFVVHYGFIISSTE